MADGAGASGRGDIDPEPVVEGGMARVLLPVVIGGELLLLAVVSLVFQLATTMKPINTNTARPAIQPHGPLGSSRRSTGSLKRGSVLRGSVNLGSDMISSIDGRRRKRASPIEKTR